jgi:hypothetical protein
MTTVDHRIRPTTLCIALLWLQLAPATVAHALVLIGSWPTQGSPLGIAIEPPGTVLLNTPSAVPEFLRYSADGTLLAHVGIYPYAVAVYGIAVAPNNGDIFYSVYRPGIFAFVHIGTYESYFGGPWGGAESSQYVALSVGSCSPYNIPGPCIDAYVTDPIGNVVVKFRSSSSAAYGAFFLQAWSSNHPSGVATFGGVVYVASHNGGTITKYTTDGIALGSFPTGAIAAEGLAAGPDGRLYLADRGGVPGSSKLLVFSTQGALVDSVGSVVGGYTYGPPEYVGVVVASDGTVFAGDYSHARVLKFSPSTTTASKAVTWGRLKASYR